MATIIGTAGSDTLIGTIGNDFIDTRGGIDEVDGGAGEDTVRLTGPVPDGNQTVGIIDGGIMHDVLDLTGWQGALQDHDVGGFLGFFEISPDTGHSHWVGYVRNFEEVHLGAGVQSFSAYQESVENPATMVGWTIVGSDVGDRITDSRGWYHINSGDGDDFVTFMGGSDQVSLGNGDDQFAVVTDTGYHDHVALDGGAGSDTLRVERSLLGSHATVDLEAGPVQIGTTSVTITGVENLFVDSAFVEPQPGWTLVVAGSEGANHLNAGGGGEAILLGRGGDDLIEPGQFTGVMTAFGGPGNDFIIGNDAGDWLNGGGHYPGDTIPAASTNDGADHLQGGAGNDHIYGNSQFAVQGSVDGGDLIFSQGGADYVNGNAGDDSIYAGDGSDRLYGGADNDLIYGENGNDHLNGNKGNDTLFGGNGNDEILGGQGDDRIFGDDGDDKISGGLGDDFINGIEGYDTLTGDAGNDVFVIYGSSFALSGPQAGRTDVVTDFQDGHDKLSIVSSITAFFHPGSASDIAAGAALAGSVFSPNGGGDLAAVQVGADTYLFFGNSGHGPTSAVCLTNVDATTIDTSDFV